ncbi:hypothetical protein [Deinococcus yavapaiensis]|uniref:FecR protein domain-containing protein n=1 Tax=Deinococcus yavapaiensis KR-236 TaxID=694435 RepID=A0A318S921_9DEIO|nr:hypothetical protein [Deinococcus yavapaiensis]PYE55205.1 hypothetical protein DES52_10335 [Deinococcus yavapaiensis KR-236]
MNFKATCIIGVLLLGSAFAQGGVSNTTSVTSQARAELSAAVLLDAQGHLVGTIDQAGRVVTSTTVSAATQVRVTFTNGASKTFQLAQRLEAQSRASLDTILVQGAGVQTSLRQAIQSELGASVQTSVDVAQALRGKLVSFVDATGQVVGSIQANGDVRASADLRQATAVVVLLESGQRLRYDLASGVAFAADGRLNVERLDVRGTDGATPLLSVLVNLSQGVQVQGSSDATAPAASEPSGPPATGSAGGGVSVGIGVGIGIGIGIGGK